MTEMTDNNSIQPVSAAVSDAAFSDRLLSWYDANRRSLPWRDDPSPYHVWLSEIMLQQTRVEAVKSYYARFLSELPDIASLAAAGEDLYMKLWEGLGYYSRVRNLHAGAVMVTEQYGGQMPQTASELQKIPGIGSYTSAAIASIAFGECIPAIDGNLLRIFARLTCYPESIREEKAKKAAAEYFRSRMACSTADRPGDFNQALMDLGSAVCLPNLVPLCEACPLRSFCSAHAAGQTTEYPLMPEKKARKVELLTIFLIHDKDRIALRKRPARGLLAGLYEYPHVPGHLTQKEALAAVRDLGFSALRIRPLPAAKHIFTHKEWHMTGYEILSDELTESGAGLREPEQSIRPGEIFLASISEIRDVYALPSAFAVYTERVI